MKDENGKLKDVSWGDGNGRDSETKSLELAHRSA